MYRRSDVIPQAETKSLVNESGNSDVDVTVNIETTAIAYALACYYYADGRLDKNQYETMLSELDEQFKKRRFHHTQTENKSKDTRPFWVR